MECLKLNVKNVGSIEEFEIDLSGLTVISGLNDSGKTALSKIIFSLGQARANPKHFIKLENKEDVISALDFIQHLQRFIRFNLFDKLKESGEASDFYSDFVKNEQKIQSHLNIIRQIIENEVFNFNLTESFMSDFIESLNLLLNEFDEEHLKETLEHSIGILSDFFSQQMINQSHVVARSFFNSLKHEFSNEIVRKDAKNRQSEIILTINTQKSIIKFTDDDILSIEGEFDIPFVDSTLIDGPYIFIVDRILNILKPSKEDIAKLGIPNHVFDIIAKIKGTKENLRYINKNQNALRIEKKYEGVLKYEPATKQFRLNKANFSFLNNNTSSGIKALSIIELLFEGYHLNQESLLIIDEPETNLHPAWQTEYAQYLVQLAKMNIPIFINTHSPYILESIYMYSVSEQINTHFYFAKLNDGKSVIKKIDGDISDIVEVLSKPLRGVYARAEEGNVDDF